MLFKGFQLLCVSVQRSKGKSDVGVVEGWKKTLPKRAPSDVDEWLNKDELRQKIFTSWSVIVTRSCGIFRVRNFDVYSYLHFLHVSEFSMRKILLKAATPLVLFVLGYWALFHSPHNAYLVQLQRRSETLQENLQGALPICPPNEFDDFKLFLLTAQDTLGNQYCCAQKKKKLATKQAPTLVALDTQERCLVSLFFPLFT